nr:F-box domain, leucine-rich repeat domain, L domain-like protein [Tanacetum cinerariifolium]
TQFDLRPHIKSPDWTVIEADIQQHLQKAYNTNKVAFKAHHWVIDTETGSYNVEKIRRARPESITTSECDKHSSATQEYPSLIDTFFVAHTVDGVFTWDEDRLIYRGHILGVVRVLPARATTSPSMPPDKLLKNLHKKVNFMMSLFKSDSKYSDMFVEFESGGARGSGGCGDDEESADDQEYKDGNGDGDSDDDS